MKPESTSDDEASRYPTTKPGAVSGNEVLPPILANNSGNGAMRRSRRLADKPQRSLPRPLRDGELDGNTDTIERPRRKFAHLGPVPDTDDDSEDEYRLPALTHLPTIPVSGTKEHIVYGDNELPAHPAYDMYGSELPDHWTPSFESAAPPVPAATAGSLTPSYKLQKKCKITSNSLY